MHVLILPSWYPPQGGDFFKIQAEKISTYSNFVGVIYLEEYSVKELFNFTRLRQILKLKYCKENTLHVIRYSWIRFPKFEWLNLQIRVLFYRKLFRAYLKQHGKPDILHTHSALWGGYFCSKLKKKHDIPYVITEHRGRFNIKNKLTNTHIRWWFKMYLFPALFNAGKIICVTKHQITYFKNQFKSLSENSFVEIPNLFENSFANISLKKKNSDRPFSLLSIAIFSEYKNHQLLIRAVECLVNQGEKDIRVFLAGDGELKTDCEKMVKEKGLDSYINFMGFCSPEELITIFEKSDYLILSSLSEGQPVSILESLAMGTPVIVPDIITERIVNKEYGFVYMTGNLDDLVRKINQAKKSVNKFDPELLRKHAIKNFSAEAIIPEIIDVYNEVYLNHKTYAEN